MEGCAWCCRGDVSGEPLDSDDLSEPEEWMDCSCIMYEHLAENSATKTNLHRPRLTGGRGKTAHHRPSRMIEQPRTPYGSSVPWLTR